MQAYLLHFNRPFGHARHYLGITTNIAYRLRRHKKGTGAVLMKHVVAAGIRFIVAREWFEEDKPEGLTWREFEIRLKNRGGASRLCPKCRAIAQKEAAKNAKSNRRPRSAIAA